MDESELIRKLKLIEALHARADTPGEQDAAASALRRFQDRLTQERMKSADPSEEYTFTVPDLWRRKLLMALMRRHGIQPYRYPRQRHTTLRARTTKRFVDETLWPEYQAMSRELSSYLEDATHRIITEVVHEDSSDAEVVAEPKQISWI